MSDTVLEIAWWLVIGWAVLAAVLSTACAWLRVPEIDDTPGNGDG